MEGHVREPQNLAVTRAPPLDYRPCMPPCEGLSPRQYETVARACQATASPPHGFFLGDGCGTGKGRIIAGILREHALRAAAQGQTFRGLWVSANVRLKRCADQDFVAVGEHGDPWVPALRDPADDTSSDEDDEVDTFGGHEPASNGFRRDTGGVCFATYASLREHQEQYSKWLAGAAACTVVFDEAHMMKTPNSRIFAACQRMHQAFPPRARVVYSTATVASEIRHIGFMDRLALWGAGQAFGNFAAFRSALARYGPVAMELVAVELKQRGLYLCRSLSIEDLDIRARPVRLGPWWTDAYDTYAGLFRELRYSVADRSRFLTGFLNIAKMDTCHAAIDASLAADEAVMVTVQSTGEAAQRRSVENRPTNICTDILRRDFRVPPHMAGWLKNRLDPVDSIVHAYGEGNVAELTSRTHRWVFSEATGQWLRVKVPSFRSELDAFQTGAKRIAVLSAAASTGLSMHDVTGRHARHHIFVEVPWSACAFMQQIGRSNRSHQMSAPRYTFLKTGIPGEGRRFQALSWGLTRLGALTCADQGNKIRPFAEVFDQVPDHEAGGQAAFVNTMLYVWYRDAAQHLGLPEDFATRNPPPRMQYRSAKAALTYAWSLKREWAFRGETPDMRTILCVTLPHVRPSCGWSDYARRFHVLPATVQGELIALRMMARRPLGEGGGFDAIGDDMVKAISEYLVPGIADRHVRPIMQWVNYAPSYGVEHFFNALVGMPIDIQRVAYGYYTAQYAKACKARKRILSLEEYVYGGTDRTGFTLDVTPRPAVAGAEDRILEVVVRYEPIADRMPQWVDAGALVGVFRRNHGRGPPACVVRTRNGFAVNYAGRSQASRTYASIDALQHAGYVASRVDRDTERAWRVAADQYHVQRQKRAARKSRAIRFANGRAIEKWDQSQGVVVRVDQAYVDPPFTGLVLG